jgi:plasmid stability protein
MTYTISNIPPDVEAFIRARAAAEHKSAEQAIVDTLVSYLDNKVKAANCHESSGIEGAWRDDPGFAAAIRDQSLIDWEAWSDGVQRRDFSGIAGQHLITQEMKEVFAEQRRVDPELWK